MLKSKLLNVLAFLSVVNAACGTQEQSELNATKSKYGCRLAPACIKDAPKLPKASGFTHGINKITAKLGKPQHRGRDVIAVQGRPVWIQAKFTFAMTDNDIVNENVDIYLSSACTSPWKKIGSGKTTRDGQHEVIDSVSDSGGRLYVELGSLIKGGLPVGKHKLMLVLTGDNSMTELNIDILPRDAKVVVSDIDGTLTTSEMAAATEVIGIQPKRHDGSAELLHVLYEKGYHIFYLTARPEWLAPQTREWLKDKGFPPGSLHTTNSPLGAQGEAAKQYKIGEMQLLKLNTGITPSMAFGNKASDVEAFGASKIPAANSFYFKLEGDAKGGVNHSDYTKLIPSAQRLQNVCR